MLIFQGPVSEYNRFLFRFNINLMSFYHIFRCRFQGYNLAEYKFAKGIETAVIAYGCIQYLSPIISLSNLLALI